MGGASASLPLSSSWWDIRQVTRDDSEALNGLKLANVYVHDALEVILSYTSLDEILTLTQVCRLWKDLTTRRSFWKLVFDRNNLDWNSIPEHVKEKPTAWMVFYAVSRNGILSKNFILNHSGEDQVANWKLSHSGGPGFKIESPPVGIPPLPHDPEFENCCDSAFVSSYGWCTQQQTIDLWTSGLTPAVMKTLIPFQFVCTEMIGARFDCDATYRIHVCLVDKTSEEILDERLKVGNLEALTEWSSENVTLQVNPDRAEELNDIRYLVVTNHGKDGRFWAGHYGSKFSRISVRVKCLNQSDQEQEGGPTKPVFIKKRVNEQNWGNEYPYGHVGWFVDDIDMDPYGSEPDDSDEYSEAEEEGDD